tara:strand:+ start:46 stop:234 length:189 start_codon:yes stop_codon:yes gene_type:complete
MNKIDYNKKMVGKSVLVESSGANQWKGKIVSVLDEDTFLISNPKTGITFKVSIYDVRSSDGK